MNLSGNIISTTSHDYYICGIDLHSSADDLVFAYGVDTVKNTLTRLFFDENTYNQAIASISGFDKSYYTYGAGLSILTNNLPDTSISNGSPFDNALVNYPRRKIPYFRNAWIDDYLRKIGRDGFDINKYWANKSNGF